MTDKALAAVDEATTPPTMPVTELTREVKKDVCSFAPARMALNISQRRSAARMIVS